MYQYTDSNYNSLVNDFGDGYHKPDVESNYIGHDIVTRLRNLKRRYRDVGEYCDAMSLINRYIDSLIDLYGGKKKFKLMLQLGMVKEYIPVIPILRKTRASKWFFSKDSYRKYTDKVFEPDEYEIEPNTKITDCEFKVGKISDKNLKATLEKGSTDRYVMMHLDAIENYYADKIGKPKRTSKKRLKKKILKRRKRDMRDDYITMDERIDNYYYYKDYGVDPYQNPDELINYKGTTFTIAQAEEYEVFDELRALGINLGVKQLSTKTRKIVRNKERRKKRAAKKKKRAVKLQKEYMKQFTDKYDTFNNFKKELGTMVRG